MDIVSILISLLAVAAALWAECGVRKERRRTDTFRDEYEKRLSELQIRQLELEQSDVASARIVVEALPRVDKKLPGFTIRNEGSHAAESLSLSTSPDLSLVLADKYLPYPILAPGCHFELHYADYRHCIAQVDLTYTDGNGPQHQTLTLQL